MTPQEIFSNAAQLGQLAFLCGIFFRIGRIGATLEYHDKRLTKIEERKALHV